MAERDPYDLIQELASNDQIKDVLRKYKLLADDPTIKKELLVGGNQDDLIARLKKAVLNDRIPFAAVAELIRQSEENGNQHILYYSPRSAGVSKLCRNGPEVAVKLFGTKWQSEMEFPRYFENSEGYSWADFRIGLPNKPNDWVAKLYTREPSLKFVNQVTQENGDVVKTFKPEYERIVALARWNAPNLLEVRITRCESRDKLRMRLHGIWKKLSPALKQELDFIEWDVRSIRKKMLESRRENETIFTTGSLQLTDSQSGKIIVHPNTPEEGADDADERSAAIDAVLGDNRCVCDHLAITYLQSGSSNVLERDLRVSIGGRYDHEILVSAQASLQAVDYVTDQLRSFE